MLLYLCFFIGHMLLSMLSYYPYQQKDTSYNFVNYVQFKLRQMTAFTNFLHTTELVTTQFDI